MATATPPTLHLLHFAHRHLNFRLAELDSLLRLAGCDPRECYDRRSVDLLSPFLKVRLPARAVEVLTKRCVLLKAVYHLLGEGRDVEEVAKEVRQGGVEALDHETHFGAAVSFRIMVEAHGRTLSLERQAELRKHFAFLPFEGPVRLNDPDVSFWYGEEYELPDLRSDRRGNSTEEGAATESDADSGCDGEAGTGTGSGTGPGTGETESGAALPAAKARSQIRSPTRSPPTYPPRACYFGLFRGHGRRDLVARLSLKARSYLGPTSMDQELSLIMANIAGLKRGGMVLDPFVGTGSVLVACAAFGAQCFGTDIDIRVLRGKQGKDVFHNFAQYNLPMPELVRSDNAHFDEHFRLPSAGIFQAVISDPPYGIRAGARQSGTRRAAAVPVPSFHRDDHIPQTKPYPVTDVMFDLLDMAARALVRGGVLAYILPCGYDFDVEKHLPRHPVLELRETCEQGLTRRLARRLVVMEKIRNYEAGKRAEYRDRSYLPVEEAELPYEGLKEKVKKQSAAVDKKRLNTVSHGEADSERQLKRKKPSS